MAKPIAITLGDPAGVGPEVVLKTVLTTPQPKHPWILIGSLWSLQRSVAIASEHMRYTERPALFAPPASIAYLLKKKPFFAFGTMFV